MKTVPVCTHPYQLPLFWKMLFWNSHCERSSICFFVRQLHPRGLCRIKIVHVVGHVHGLRETLRVRAAMANVALMLMKYTHAYMAIPWRVKRSEQSYVHIFFYPSRQINTRPQCVLPIRKMGGRVSSYMPASSSSTVFVAQHTVTKSLLIQGMAFVAQLHTYA